jgi:hypothetical protein
MMRVALAALVLLLPRVAAAQTAAPHPAQAPQRLTIPRVGTPPSLDDYVDGVPRSDEVAVTSFYQREPGDGAVASQPTEAYLSYDSEHLYIIFIARDREPQNVRATLTKREAFGNDDFVGLLLDTFKDKRRAYLFIVNPLGVQIDGVSTDSEQDDLSFDTVWQSEGRLTPFGYVVRIAIPFKSLRFSNAPEQEWGIALARAIRRNNETSFWPYITRRVSGVGQQMATAGGLRDISPGRNIQFIPYAALTRARFLDEPTPAFVSDSDGRAGIDAKMVIKDAFTVDATFNPDFSQVESDEPQVTINQRFEVFFPEKRPFFIENAGYFQTPINLFFSRRIADPQGGLRVTGKSGGWAVGGLAIDDRAPGRALDPLDPARGDRTGIGVVRFQRDLPNQSAFGVLATTRDFATSESRVISMDGRYKMTDTWTLSGQAAVSHFRPLSGGTQAGPALSLELDRTGRNWGAFLRYEDISADFRAPLGFVRRVDMREVRPFVRYTWFSQKGALVSIRPELSGSMLWDHAGTLQDWEVSSEVRFELKGQTEFEAGYDETMERFGGVEFRKRGATVSFETSALVKWLEAFVQLERGSEINFFPGSGLLPFLASGTEAAASITLKPIAPLRIDQTYLFTRLTTRDNVTPVRPGAVIVDNHIWRTRASYQFTRNLSLRAILDYAAVLPEVSLIDLERDKHFSADLLVTYQLNPWTALYIGYADAYRNLEIDPLSRDRLRPTDSVFNSTGRQVFVKLSYLFRF